MQSHLIQCSYRVLTTDPLRALKCPESKAKPLTGKDLHAQSQASGQEFHGQLWSSCEIFPTLLLVFGQ